MKCYDEGGEIVRFVSDLCSHDRHRSVQVDESLPDDLPDISSRKSEKSFKPEAHQV